MSRQYPSLSRDTIDSRDDMSFGNREDSIEQEISRDFRMISSSTIGDDMNDFRNIRTMSVEDVNISSSMVKHLQSSPPSNNVRDTNTINSTNLKGLNNTLLTE